MGWFQNLFARGNPAPITSAAKAKERLSCPAPTKRPTMNIAGKQIVMKSEGLELKPYLCPAGIPTIGRGATYGPDMEPVTMDDDSISVGVANSMFERDMRHFSDRVRNLIDVTVTDNQFSALVSLAYNIGTGALRRSKLLAKLNREDYAGAAGEFWDFRNKRGPNGRLMVLPGLVIRRALEKKLFLS